MNDIFQQSDDITKIVPALGKINGTPVIENSENSHLRSKYANLNAIWQVLRPLLSENELSVVQSPGDLQWHEQSASLGMVTQVQHASGQWMRGKMQIPIPEPILNRQGGSVINFAQRLGSATTYAKRYALISFFCLVTGDDDDAAMLTEKAEAPIYDSKKAAASTWQELYLGNGWQVAPAPGENAWGTLAELAPGELKTAIKDNATNDYANKAVVAASAALTHEAARKRGYEVVEALTLAGWTGEATIEKMEPKDIMLAYNVIVALKAKEGAES